MARAGGIILEPKDFSDLSDAIPLMARIYPNGLADVNHFHAAGGLGYMIGSLLEAGLLHPDVRTVAGNGLDVYTQEPALQDDALVWKSGADASLNTAILRPARDAFQKTGGLVQLQGPLGASVMKISAVAEEHRFVEAPVRVFHSQEAVKAAFRAGEFTRDVIVVVRFQGPSFNGMPELHGLTPVLSILQGRGLKVALITDGRMSGASGKVPAAIHVCPEAAEGGLIAKLQDGDVIRIDAQSGILDVLTEGVADREPATETHPDWNCGMGRELFAAFRSAVGPADRGASVMGETA